MRKAWVALILAQVVLAVAVAISYGTLPEPVATHFDAHGAADAWASRPEYATQILGGGALIAALCVAPLYLARRLPDSMIHIPDREYWLAPERRAGTFDRLYAMGLAIAATATGLFVGMHALTVKANRLRPARIEPAETIALVAAFLTVLVGVLYAFRIRPREVDGPA